MKKNVYILHETGAPTHYHALRSLAEKNGDRVKFYEFQKVLNYKHPYMLIRHIVAHPYRAIRNIIFLLSLPFYEPSKIVLAVAPFYSNLPLLMRLTRKHEIYYHTSYSCWDGSRYSHKPQNDAIIAKWHYFTQDFVKHIFSVSKCTKEQLIKNGFATADKISVVNHSFTKKIEIDLYMHNNNKFIVVALLHPKKGIKELLEIFARHPEATLTIIGAGELEGLVKKYAAKYKNIVYKGYIQGSHNIIPYYKENSFLILNSQRTKTWEELFGMAIVEGMACGCVPITTDHPGPREIYVDGQSGFMCKEGDIEKGIIKAINLPNDAYLSMRRQAYNIGLSYYCENMEGRWSKIYD